jgi:flavin-dependent dehydrogenase
LNYPVSRRTAGNVCDALVVGGGPAGLAAGIALRQSGLDVVVADALVPPIDKACGEGLTPDSVREIQRLGVDLEDGYSFSGIRFVDGKRVATARFPAGPGIGIRRVGLHRKLEERAEGAGSG